MKDRLLARVATQGPVPFEEFMREALYGDGGFFSSQQLRSVKSGDFLTSPEVSPLFGETIAAFVKSERDRIGEPFSLVEVAAGSGSLLRSLLTVIEVPAHAVEVSPAARRALAELLGAARVHADMSNVPRRGVVLANELIDNLPMAIAQLTESGWRERWVGAGRESLEFVDAPPRPEVLSWLEMHAGPVEVGGWVEVQIEAGSWLRGAIQALEAGSVLLFDYGDTKENLAPRRGDGTLRTYRAHHLGPHPLDEPGATDITADVNFSALADIAEASGANVEVARQDEWLGRWGLRHRISRLRHRELELARAGEEMDRLRVRTVRQEAETLMNARGLGDFRVLVASV